MDVTKSVRADFRHRAIRHHLFGIEEGVRRTFPEAVLKLHVEEDCGYVPSLEDWWSRLRTGGGAWRTRPVVSSEEQAAHSASVYRAPAEVFLPLHAWLDRPLTHWNHPDARGVTHHAFGAFWAEEYFGPVLAMPDGRHIPTRVVVEQHGRYELGTLPSADAWCGLIQSADWMFAAVGQGALATQP